MSTQIVPVAEFEQSPTLGTGHRTRRARIHPSGGTDPARRGRPGMGLRPFERCSGREAGDARVVAGSRRVGDSAPFKEDDVADVVG